MKQLSSSLIGSALIISLVFYSCKTDKNSSKNKGVAKDTITTASGLKYFYITKGKGRRVEPGAKVDAVLSLKVKDSVIWTSYSAKDSIFSYIADRGGVVKGYNEMALLLREGDAVTAIMPSSIAYGERGSGAAIPPNSTLIYNQFKIKHVSEPRLVLSDTLFYALKNKEISKMKTIYKQVTTTKDSALYFGGLNQLNNLWRKLVNESMFDEAFKAFSYISKFNDAIILKFYAINSLENQEKFKQAIDEVNAVLKGSLSADQRTYFLKYKAELTKELKAKK